MPLRSAPAGPRLARSTPCLPGRAFPQSFLFHSPIFSSQSPHCCSLCPAPFSSPEACPLAVCSVVLFLPPRLPQRPVSLMATPLPHRYPRCPLNIKTILNSDLPWERPPGPERGQQALTVNRLGTRMERTS